MRIDAHGHACAGYATVESIIEQLNAYQIDKVIMFPAEIGTRTIVSVPPVPKKWLLRFTNVVGTFFARFMNLPEKIDFGNTYVYYLSQLAPDRIIQFYQPTPKYLYKLEEDYKRMQFSGIKLHQCVSYFSLRSDFFMTILDFAEHHQLPLQIHLYSKQDARDLIAVVKNRNLTVIVAHLLFYKTFAQEWDQVSEQFFFDVANYYFIDPIDLQNALTLFGPQKLIFGSDNPFGLDSIQKTIAMIEQLELSSEDKEAMLGGSMRRILGL